MIDYNKIYDDVYDIVSPLCEGFPLIRDVQSDVKPAESYLTYRIIRFKNIGFSQHTATNAPGVYDIHRTYSLTIRFKAIGDNAASIAARLHMKLQRFTVIDSFESAGLNIYNRTDIKDSPRLVSTGYEDQSIFEIDFYTVVTDQDNVGWIEFVELEQTIKNEADQTIIQTTQTIDLDP